MSQKNKPYIEVPKSFKFRLHELTQAANIIFDSLNSLRDRGKVHQLIPLYGQLRSLLIEKSKKNNPLLLSIADELKMDLKFFCLPEDVLLNMPLTNDARTLQVGSLPITLIKELTGQIEVNLRDFLDLKVVNCNKKFYSARKIIWYFANQAGGAHYPTKISKEFADMLSFGLLSQPMLSNLLIQIAEVTYKLVLKILTLLTDFEIHTLIFLPSQQIKKDSPFFDFKLNQLPVRLTLKINKLFQLILSVTDYQGRTFSIKSEISIKDNKPYYLCLGLYLTKDLKSNLIIYINGEEAANVIIPEIIEIWNDAINYEKYYNKFYNDPHSGFCYGLAFLAMYGKKLSLNEKSEMISAVLNGIENRDYEKFWFLPKTYGYSPAGKNDISII